MRVLLCGALVFSLFCNNAFAAIVSRIDSANYGTEGWNYNFTISEWGQSSEPNPCYGQGNTCLIGISHVHGSSGGPGEIAGYVLESCISEAKTMDLLRACVLNKPLRLSSGYKDTNLPSTLSFPMSGTLVHQGQFATIECVGLFYGNSAALVGPLPGSVCGVGPSPTYSCELPTTINLDHGTLSPDEINGSIATKNVSITCTGDMSLKLALDGMSNGKLALGTSGIDSTISINNTVLPDNGINENLKSGTNSFTIKSTLSVSGTPQTGNHSGNGVLVLAVQ